MLWFIIRLSVTIMSFAIFCIAQSGIPTELPQSTIPNEKSSPVTVPKFETPPVIDGKLDEDIWRDAAQFKNFVQTEPGYLIAPSKETIAYMGYDAQNLYIGFFCFDEPDKIRATVAKRDEVGGGLIFCSSTPWEFRPTVSRTSGIECLISASIS
jgi:hypothetical protein